MATVRNEFDGCLHTGNCQGRADGRMPVGLLLLAGVFLLSEPYWIVPTVFTRLFAAEQ